jgi:hypothetical protein
MISLQNVKLGAVVFSTATVATDASTTGYVDCRGYSYALLQFTTPVATATNSSAKVAALQVNHSDSTSSTGTALIAGTTNATAGTSQFVLGAHNDTANAQVVHVGVDLRGRGRYLYYTITTPAAPTASRFSLQAILSRPEQSPDTTTEKGVTGFGFV